MDCSWATLKCELFVESLKKPEIGGENGFAKDWWLYS
jgi:hypothetical protein